MGRRKQCSCRPVRKTVTEAETWPPAEKQPPSRGHTQRNKVAWKPSLTSLFKMQEEPARLGVAVHQITIIFSSPNTDLDQTHKEKHLKLEGPVWVHTKTLRIAAKETWW